MIPDHLKLAIIDALSGQNHFECELSCKYEAMLAYLVLILTAC